MGHPHFGNLPLGQPGQLPPLLPQHQQQSTKRVAKQQRKKASGGKQGKGKKSSQNLQGAGDSRGHSRKGQPLSGTPQGMQHGGMHPQDHAQMASSGLHPYASTQYPGSAVSHGMSHDLAPQHSHTSALSGHQGGQYVPADTHASQAASLHGRPSFPGQSSHVPSGAQASHMPSLHGPSSHAQTGRAPTAASSGGQTTHAAHSSQAASLHGLSPQGQTTHPSSRAHSTQVASHSALEIPIESSRTGRGSSKRSEGPHGSVTHPAHLPGGTMARVEEMPHLSSHLSHQGHQGVAPGQIDSTGHLFPHGQGTTRRASDHFEVTGKPAYGEIGPQHLDATGQPIHYYGQGFAGGMGPQHFDATGQPVQYGQAVPGGIGFDATGQHLPSHGPGMTGGQGQAPQHYDTTGQAPLYYGQGGQGFTSRISSTRQFQPFQYENAAVPHFYDAEGHLISAGSWDMSGQIIPPHHHDSRGPTTYGRSSSIVGQDTFRFSSPEEQRMLPASYGAPGRISHQQMQQSGGFVQPYGPFTYGEPAMWDEASQRHPAFTSRSRSRSRTYSACPITLVYPDSGPTYSRRGGRHPMVSANGAAIPLRKPDPWPILNPMFPHFSEFAQGMLPTKNFQPPQNVSEMPLCLSFQPRRRIAWPATSYKRRTKFKPKSNVSQR